MASIHICNILNKAKLLLYTNINTQLLFCHQVVIEHERNERTNMEAHLRQKVHELLDRQSKVDMQEADFSGR